MNHATFCSDVLPPETRLLLHLVSTELSRVECFQVVSEAAAAAAAACSISLDVHTRVVFSDSGGKGFNLKETT